MARQGSHHKCIIITRNNIVITHKNYLIAGEISGSVYFYEYVRYVMIHKKIHVREGDI